MLLQTNSYIVPKDKRAEHARLLRRFRQALARLGCDQFEVYEQVGANWSAAGPESTGRVVQIMRFRDRKHQLAVQAAERNDPGAQALIAEFCELINFPYQQQRGLFAVGFYNAVLPTTVRGHEPAQEEHPEPEPVPPAEEEAAPETKQTEAEIAAAAAAAAAGVVAAGAAAADALTDESNAEPVVERAEGEQPEPPFSETTVKVEAPAIEASTPTEAVPAEPTAPPAPETNVPPANEEHAPPQVEASGEPAAVSSEPPQAEANEEFDLSALLDPHLDVSERQTPPPLPGSVLPPPLPHAHGDNGNGHVAPPPPGHEPDNGDLSLEGLLEDDGPAPAGRQNLAHGASASHG